MSEPQAAPQGARDEKHIKMMSTGTGWTVVVRSDTGKSSLGQVRIQQWGRRSELLERPSSGCSAGGSRSSR